MKLVISFPGNKKVTAGFNGFTVTTDQPTDHGGNGTDPAPFELFLASIGTCAGYFVKAFCDERNLNTEGLSITEEAIWDPKEHRLSHLDLTLHLPVGFPEKYKPAVISAANLCSVKKAIANPPEFSIRAES